MNNVIRMQLSRVIDRAVNAGWEFVLGIETRGTENAVALDGYRYSTLSYTLIRRILGEMDLTESDTLVDIGCGRGRTVCTASLLRMRKVIGIEINDKLCREAKANALRMRMRRSPIEIVNARAQDCAYEDCTAIYLFNPFGADTLAAVLSRIGESCSSFPRTIRIAYANPVHEGVLKRTPGWQRYKLLENFEGSFPVAFWKFPG